MVMKSYLQHDESECVWPDCRVHVRKLTPVPSMPNKIQGLKCPFCHGVDFRLLESEDYVGCAECGFEADRIYCLEQPKAPPLQVEHAIGRPSRVRGDSQAPLGVTARDAVESTRRHAREAEAQKIVDIMLASGSALARLLMGLERIRLVNK